MQAVKIQVANEIKAALPYKDHGDEKDVCAADLRGLLAYNIDLALAVLGSCWQDGKLLDANAAAAADEMEHMKKVLAARTTVPVDDPAHLLCLSEHQKLVDGVRSVSDEKELSVIESKLEIVKKMTIQRSKQQPQT
eukprot:10023842-Lingulodinium_polyedra.AAC.1